jgi:membrane-anchored protein YejM (alkaline phosphatase superfamily)
MNIINLKYIFFQVIDSELAAMLKRLYSSGAMNNTMMLLFGDHGNRFDDIRKTVIGRVEERMPFLAIYLPKSLDHLRKQVEANSKILISWHDVYETIMDVATKNLLQKSQQV